MSAVDLYHSSAAMIVASQIRRSNHVQKMGCAPTTYKYFRVLLILFVLVSTLIDACSFPEEEATETLMPSSPYLQGFLPISTTTVLDMAESNVLSSSLSDGPVAALHLNPTNDSLLAVYIGSGLVKEWNIRNNQVLDQYYLGITSHNGVGFDQSGALLLGATQSETRSDFNGLETHFIGGVGVWQTGSGLLIDCILYPCEGPPDSDQFFEWIGAAIDPKGRWVFYYSSISFTIRDLSGLDASVTTVAYPDRWRTISQAIFDSNGGRYAIAYKQGEIVIRGIEDQGLGLLGSGVIVLGNYHEDLTLNVQALAFSHDGKSLAAIRDNHLSVWNVGRRSGNLYFETDQPDGKYLAFDASDQLLVVATSDMITFWSLDKRSTIVEFPAPNITTMVISPDNRSLIWADKDGAIHIWGIQ